MSLIMTDKQRTAEWYQARLGFLSASRFREATSFLKNGAETAERASCKADIARERKTGVREDIYVDRNMQRGIDLEEPALNFYSEVVGVDVQTTGFVRHPTIDWLGCSPDGLVGNDGLIEIKVPKQSTYWSWILAGEIPAKHIAQLTCQLAVTGRQWVDFVAFCPEMPEGQQLFVRRMHRDERVIAQAEQDAIQFLSEVQEQLDRLEVIQWIMR